MLFRKFVADMSPSATSGTSDQMEVTPIANTKWICRWKISNFSELLSRMDFREVIVSKRFNTSFNGNICHWQLRLYPTGFSTSFISYIAVFLKPLHTFETEIKYTFIVLDATGNIHLSNGPNHMSFHGRSYGVSNLIKRSEIMDASKNILTNNSLFLACEINHNINEDVVNNLDIQSNSLHTLPVEELLSNFELLLDNGKWSDVTFIIGDKHLHAHKAILSERSSVFAAMFEHDMQEKQTSRVDVTDLEYDVLKELFRFIYCCRVQRIDELAEKLLAAADKYDVRSLKTLCEGYLCESLTVENVIERFKIGNLYKTENLNQTIKEFMAENSKKIVKNSKFRASVLNLDEDLILQAFEVMILKE